ncbi:MAG: hemolysin III family protein [Kineosporiaceae bacterium]|nr:hemolysin III family protein [Kineosporiaceae bacterium]
MEEPRAARPLLRGWLHAVTAPAALAYGVVLVVLAQHTAARVSVGVFAGSAALLFTISATFHRRHWGPRMHAVLQRLDHAAIFLVIAGSYTPFSVLLLPPGPARTLLALVWGGALAGVAFRVFWLHAPRWLYTPTYIVLGWAALAFLPDFLDAGHPAALTLAVVGGVLYTAGGVIYGLRRPDPSPRWFGFHEIFHALTVAAFVAHAVGVGLVVGAADA